MVRQVARRTVPTVSLPEDRLVAAAQAGDPAAWEALYRAHSPGLLAWLRTQDTIDSAATHDDVAATTWLTASERIHTYSGPDDRFAGWLFTIAKNHTRAGNRTALRRATDSVAPADLTDLPSGGTASDPADTVAAETHVLALLALLTGRDRDIVAARDIAGLSVAETAHLLHLSPAAVRVAHHRALGRLRRQLR